MIVFDLRCGVGHVFEAWFGSTEDYDRQRAAERVSCPMCGDVAVAKAVMAPNVASKGNRSVAPADAKAMLARLAKAQAKVLGRSTWVGRDFASEARAIHAGEKPEASIYGQASPAEVTSLLEEGVPVAPLPLPVVPPESVN